MLRSISGSRRGWKPSTRKTESSSCSRRNFPPTRKDEFWYFEIDLRLDQVEAAACNFTWDDLREGSFLELAYYGEDKEPKRDRDCIGTRPGTTPI